MNTRRRSCTGLYHLPALCSPNWKAFCSCSLFLAIYTCIKTLLWATYQCFELWRRAFVFLLLLQLCGISENRYFRWRHHLWTLLVKNRAVKVIKNLRKDPKNIYLDFWDLQIETNFVAPRKIDRCLRAGFPQSWKVLEF